MGFLIRAQGVLSRKNKSTKSGCAGGSKVEHHMLIATVLEFGTILGK